MKFQTPPEVAQDLRIKPGKVIGWIVSGKLRAFNVGDKTRTRWRIAPEDLAEFLASRAAKPPTPKPQRAARRQKTSVVEYY